MNKQLTAYHGEPETKAKYVTRLKDHMAADELIREFGWDSATQRGCAIGCTLNAYDHARFPTELGVPVWLAHLCDFLHEYTSEDVWPTLQLRILEAIPVGFSNWHAVLKDVTLKSLEIARPYADDRGQTAIDHIAACWRGERNDWKAVYADAADAADAARSAAWTAPDNAARATREAAWAAAWAAQAAAYATGATDAKDAARTARAAVDATTYTAADTAERAADRIAEELLESIKRHSK